MEKEKAEIIIETCAEPNSFETVDKSLYELLSVGWEHLLPIFKEKEVEIDQINVAYEVKKGSIRGKFKTIIKCTGFIHRIEALLKRLVPRIKFVKETESKETWAPDGTVKKITKTKFTAKLG